ncbi:response regulator [[Brevibacterium] frigoritolerans]|nr:response regulator [Peribacillus frigoritolerans]
MANNKIKLYIVDPNSNFIDKIEGHFFEKTQYRIDVIGSATTTKKFEADKQKVALADIYLISANLPDGTGIKIVEFLKKNSVTTSKPIIFTIDKQTRNTAVVANERGVNKIFQKPFSIKDLIHTIFTLTDSPMIEQEIRQPNSNNNPLESKPTPPSAPTLRTRQSNPTPTVKQVSPPGKYEDLFNKVDANPLLNTQDFQDAIGRTDQKVKSIVTFTSVSSTGKTALLVNVAYAIQKYAKIKPKICLVDLDLLFPSVAFHFLNTELKHANRDIYDVSADLNYLSADLLSEALTYHQPTGIYILNTPTDPEFIHKIGTLKTEQIERILVHLRDMFDVILIDTSNAVTEDLVLFPMQFADKNFIVLEPNYLNVVGVNKFFYILKKLEDSMKEPIISKTHIVLNKETKNKSIYSDTTRDFLYDKKFVVRVPEDSKFMDFANQGKFIVDSDSIASASIIQLANLIYPINRKGQKKTKLNLPFFKK